jgi:hypothetical protein
MTLLGVDALDIVERVFPERFGGDATCYQIAEEEESDGRVRISIRVHPRLEAIEENVVRRVFLEEVRRTARVTPEVWARAETVRVERVPPVLREGKVWPVQAARRETQETH